MPTTSAKNIALSASSKVAGKRLAHVLHEKGIPESEISKIPATGPKGRLLKGDVLAYLGKIPAEYAKFRGMHLITHDEAVLMVRELQKYKTMCDAMQLAGRPADLRQEELNKREGLKQLLLSRRKEQAVADRPGAAPGSTDALKYRRDCTGRADLNDAVEVADVDSQLERAGGDNDAVPGFRERALRLAPLIGAE